MAKGTRLVARESLPDDASSSARIRAQYTPRALGILAAAQRVVMRDGAGKLSLRAVAREAGETSSLVLYHFSSMENLEALLLDSLWHDTVLGFMADLDDVPDDAARRIDVLVDFHSQIAHMPGLYEVYLDLVARVIPTENIRRNVAGIYRGYRDDINRPLLAVPGLTEKQLTARSALVLAAGEGIPIDALLMPRAPSQDLVFELLAHLLKRTASLAARPPALLDDPAEFDRSTPRPEFDTLPTAPAAQRLLAAGQQLIRTGGLRSLSLESIAATSGEARPAVGYYFGNKNGFTEAIALAALRDWVECFEDLLNGREGLTASGLHARFFFPASPLATLVLVMPVVLRGPDLRACAEQCTAYLLERLTDALRPQDSHNSGAFFFGLSRLFNASLIGLTLQHLYDPENFEVVAALEALNEMIQTASRQPAGQDPGGSSNRDLGPGTDR